ncbi:MAG: GtrA family protein [Anaerolineaceae bacterium]
MTLLNDSIERRRFLRFALVGISGSVVDFGVFNLLATLLHVPATIAQAVSFTLGVINNFTWNRLWTYPETRTNSVLKQLGQFSLVNVVGLGIRTILFSLIEKPIISLAAKFIPNILTPTIVGHNISLASVILVVMLWNYFANRYWTFKDFSTLKEKIN